MAAVAAVRADPPPGDEGQRRRWDDGARELPALTLARYLARQPDLDSVARFLVAMLCWPIAAQGVVILREAGAARPEILTRYVDQVADEEAGSLPVDVSVSAISSAISGRREILWTTPASPVGRPLCAWQLGAPSASVGVLVVFLSRCLDPELVRSRIEGVVDVLAAYLAGAKAPLAGARALLGAPGDGRPAGSRTARDETGLTGRQVTILRLMAKGLTNRQIAGRIGYSDSTVRSESLAIYRALGVRDREAAVAEGSALGLIP